MENNSQTNQPHDTKLPFELQQKITEFFSSLPNLRDSAAQQALLNSASLDDRLLDQLCFGVPLTQFVQILVPTLTRYGRLDDGRHALVTVLDVSKSYLGKDRQEYCDTLIQAVQEHLAPSKEEQQATIKRQIERLRQEEIQQAKLRQTAQRKSVGTKPAVEKLFVDREAYLDRLAQYICDPDIRQIIIVGQGGIGKTALAAKFCDDIEKAGYRLGINTQAKSGSGLKPANSADTIPIRAIVYVSKTEMAAFTMEQVFGKLAQTLEPEDEQRLRPLLNDPQAGVGLKTEKLLEALREGTTLLILDNFETLLCETAIQDKDLETFLKTVCETRHGLKVLITSRVNVGLDVFAGLCEPIVLNTGLDTAHAVKYLRKLGHAGRIAQLQHADEIDLRALSEKVHGVPMALRSCASFLRNRRRLSLKQLVEEQARFADFRQHDFQQGLAKLIAEQYVLLPPDAKRALEGLAVYNTPVPPVAVQYLFPELDAETVLDTLAYDYFLAQRNPVTDRFELHPTVQEFVYQQIKEYESEAFVAEEIKECKSSAFAKAEQIKECESEAFVAKAELLHSRAADFHAQLKKPEEEWKSLPDLQPHLEEIEQRIKAGDYDPAARVLNAIDSCYLHLWGYSKLVIEIREQLLDKLTDEYLIMVNYGNLGSTYCRTGRIKEALPLYENALKSARKEKNKVGEGIWLGNLGNAYADLGDLSQAIAYYTQALTIAREISHKRGEGVVLGNLGLAYADLGDLPQAIEYYTQALTIAREIGDKQGEGVDLSNLGIAYANLGDLPQAIEYYTEALTIAREIGDKQGEGIRLGNLGEAYLERYVQESTETHLAQAIECQQQALEISEEINYPITICNNLWRLGLEYLIASDMMQAETYFRRCVEACDSALARTQLSEVLYYRAFALLALHVCHEVRSPAESYLNARSEGRSATESRLNGTPPRFVPDYEQAYQKAIEVNTAAGVLKGKIHDIERLQRILEQRGFPVPAAIAKILALLRQARTAE